MCASRWLIADQWQAAAQRQSLGHVHPDHQRAGQSRSACDRDGVDVAQVQMRLLQGCLDDGVNGADVLAGGDLGKHPAELGVDVHLRGHQAGADDAPVLHHRRGGLVAGGLDPQNAHRRRSSHL